MEKEMLAIAKLKSGEGKFEKFMGWMQSDEGMAVRKTIAHVEKTVPAIAPDKSYVMFKVSVHNEQEMIHDDYQFLMHSSGNKLGKQDILKWLGMKDVKKEKVRVLFENDEVGFEHAYVSYNDGNKEAVMTYYKYKDGKVAYMETGATKLPK